MTTTTQNEQNMIFQKTYILGTGSMASASEIADFNSILDQAGGSDMIASLIDSHLNTLIAQQGVIATFQAIAKNGFGMTLSNSEAEAAIAGLVAVGVDSGAKLIDYLNTTQWEHSGVLDNRAEAATDFLVTLNSAGKDDYFAGSASTHAAYTLLQNIDGSASSLSSGIDGFDALSANLSESGITATLDTYLSGATVFADANRDGEFNEGEWSTTTSAAGTFEAPDDTVAGKIIVSGGVSLLTGNDFHGVLSSSTGSTAVNPMTTVIEAMVASGQVNTVHEASSAIKSALGLPADINLLSYNSLGVLSNDSASTAEKAVALQVQKASQQIANIITHTAEVVNTATAEATLYSAAAAVTIALGAAISAAADLSESLDLASTATVSDIVAATVDATQSSITTAHIAQIAQVTAGSNTSAAAASNITMLAQAADVAQGGATAALVAGATAGNFDSAVSAYTGAPLTSANYNATVGNIAPDVPTEPTAKEAEANNNEPEPEPEPDAAVTVNMTASLDSIDGSASDDMFSGTRGNGAGPYTFNVGDSFDGLGGVDSLYISTGAEANTPTDDLFTSVANFEKIVFESIGNGAQSITTGANFEAAFATQGVDLTVETLLGAIDVTMTTFTGDTRLTTITTGSGAHSIVTGSGATTVEATGISAGAQTIDGIGMTDVTATINGAGDQVIGTTSSDNLVNVEATILEAGSQTITSTSDEDATVVASAAAGSQTVSTASGNDSVTTTGAESEAGTINTNAGNDVIVSSKTTDLITGGTGSDTMTGGGGVDTFAFGADGSVISTDMDSITDFNDLGADILSFAGDSILLTLDDTALVAGSNVNTDAGALITFHASDSTLAAKISAIQADAELDAANSVAMFTDDGDTYVYHAGSAVGNTDDQLIQLLGVDTLLTMTGGATLVIA